MNTILKRVISLVLCFVLVAGYLPAGVLATETGETVTAEATEVTTEPTEAASEETEAPSESTDATEPSTEVTVPSTEATEPAVIAVTGITLDQTELTVGVGELPMTLVATVLPEDATDKTVTWTSSEPGVVSVEDGLLTFGYMGEAVITATAGEFSASCTVIVGEGEASWYEYTGPAYLDAAIFCSDVHGSSSDLTSTMKGVATSGVVYSAIGLVGDTCLTVATTESAVNSGLGYTPAVMFSYASSHDTENSADIKNNWNYSGEVKNVSDYYLVYTIREDDMKSDTGADDAFTSWYNGLTDAKKKLPIFIMSHRPLHDRRDDNAGAAGWYSAISAAAESSDIVFFWAHNHTGESSADTAAYYVAKDGTETFTVYNGGTVVPNFTYMNAGYINANNQNPKRIGVATTVRITADSLIFQDYSTSGEYTNSSYSHNVTVTREFASDPVTLTSIAVTAAPTTVEYTVGDTFTSEGLVVTATYSDGSTKAVTGYTLSEVDMTTAGEKEVTVTYEGKTASFKITVKSAEPTVNTVECWDDTEQVTVKATGLGLTAVEATNVTGENEKCDEVFTEYGYVAFDIALTGLVEGESVEYSISVVPDLDTTNLELYYVDENGELIPVEFQLTTDELGNVYVEFTTDKAGTFVYGSPKVPEGYALVSLTLANIPTDVFLGGSLDLLNAEITATYIKAGAEDFVRKLTAYDYDESNFSGFDVNVGGKQTVTFTFEGVTATYEIHVWGDSVTAEGVTVALDVSGEEYGVTAVNVAESTNTHVAEAVANVMSNYVAYDISLVYENGYAATEDIKTVTLPIPEGVVNPVVYYVSDNGYNVVDMKAIVNEDGKTVSFETKHFSTYVVGENTEIEVPGNQTQSGNGTTTTTQEKEVYVLVSSISEAGDYLISNTNSATTSAHLLTATTNGVTDTSNVTINTGTDVDGNTLTYIESPNTYAIWAASANSSGYRLYNSGRQRYLLRSSSSLSVTSSSSSATSWNTTKENAIYYDGNTDRYIRYSNGWSSLNSGSGTVYIYQKQTVIFETTTTVSGTYSIAGEDETVVAVKDSTFDLTSSLVFTPTSGDATTTVDPEGVTYAVYEGGDPLGVISGISGNTVTLSGKVGKALVKVSYTTNFGEVTDYITVTATTPDHYSIQLHEVELTVAAGVTADNFASNTYYTYDSKTGFYSEATAYVEGTTYYTLPVIQGDAITAPIALKGIEAGESYSVWAVVKAYATADDAEGVNIGTLGDALSWTVSDESIATINKDTGMITFTGTNYGTFNVTVSYVGADGKTITDTITISATKSLYVVPGDGTNDFPEYPNEGAVRFDKSATAVGNFSKTGIAKVELSMTGVPYSTGSEIDVVLMLDMTGSMDDVSSSTSEPTGYVRIDATIAASKAFIATIVKNEDGSYNGNRVGVYVFNKNGAATLYDFGTVDSDTELETIYGDLETIKDDHFASGGTPYDDGLGKCYEVLNAAKTDGVGNNRQQFCVFMTDGVPTDFEYINGTSHANYSSASSVAGMLTSSSNYATRDTDYKYEYYSTEMKKAGVTVYSVGVGLFNENNAWSGSATQCGNLASALLNDISGPAYEASQPDAIGTATLSKKDSYFFSVDDADAGTEMKRIFSNIAQKIVEAAKDVVVEDKIGSKYAVNFSMPENVIADDTDGLSEFYIQAVEYQLNANKERTGDPTVLENFTFNADGTLKSHTVNGTACTSCSHVTVTNGTITRIEGTYFDYKSDSSGEYLNWEAEKLSTTELALQYFVYLENSADAVGTDHEVPAGTYYTNEYATLTYTNHLGNRVQQEFPIPQMTWNGAQVSYVFYLVNEAGQPVNRAGKVIPFAEAVYVTDVFTYHVIWNDLEQSAGLEAKYLAALKVPETYALYDDDAAYQIHVYEDENRDNLNNHFVISGDVADDYNAKRTNAKTTYVFNAKSDATKYNTNGTYVADDGDTRLSETGLSYFCKSAAIEGATFTTSVENGVTVYTVTGVGSGYQAVAGETQATVSQITAAGGSTSGGTVIGNHIYYVDENGQVYTIVQKSNGTEVHKGFDFHNTTVAFAVVWKPELVEDAVVIDYGLDVVIDVIKNDNMAAGVVGVRTDKPDVVINSGEYAAAKATSVDVYIDTNNDTDGLKELKIGTATVENLNSVRFSLDDTNGMQFTDSAVFYYEADVNYYDSNNALQTTSMYSSVTVIPATTVYYEDDFLTLNSFSRVDGAWNEDETSKWTASVQNGVQDQDRPDESKISAELDADNVYGYDSAYKTMSTHSLGSSAMVHVDSNSYATAEFTFYGTGFDVISVTSNTTGTLAVQVSAGDTFNAANLERNTLVDTYYGMQADGTLSENTPDTIYQVPVIKISGLEYKQYTVRITATYNKVLDHTEADGYDLYLDAIRIYDPTGNEDETAVDAYIKDGEAYPVYEELRNNIIAASKYAVTENEDGTVTVTGDPVNGAVFIDCSDNTSAIADYVSYGPNNEVYLAKNQAIAFTIDVTENMADVQLGIKVANGNSVTYKINGDSYTVESTTDMYYSIMKYLKDANGNAQTVTIENVSGGILSLTNIKATFSGTSSTNGLVRMTAPAAASALMMLRSVPVVEEEIPETTVPEVTEPEETEPEETVPEETEPEETVPEETKPNKDAEKLQKELKKAMEKAAKEAEKLAKELQKAAEKAAKALSKLFGKWF